MADPNRPTHLDRVSFAHALAEYNRTAPHPNEDSAPFASSEWLNGDSDFQVFDELESLLRIRNRERDARDAAHANRTEEEAAASSRWNPFSHSESSGMMYGMQFPYNPASTTNETRPTWTSTSTRRASVTRSSSQGPAPHQTHRGTTWYEDILPGAQTYSGITSFTPYHYPPTPTLTGPTPPNSHPFAYPSHLANDDDVPWLDLNRDRDLEAGINYNAPLKLRKNYGTVATARQQEKQAAKWQTRLAGLAFAVLVLLVMGLVVVVMVLSAKVISEDTLGV